MCILFPPLGCKVQDEKVKVKITQSCPTFCDPMNYTVREILQARILEWRFPSPGDLPNPEIKPRSPTLQADSLPTELGGKPCHFVVTCLLCNCCLFPTVSDAP